jgi:hypothetical protein
MKICAACQTEKQKSDFYKDKRKSDGLYSSCKSCTQSKSKSWKASNPNYRSEYYLKNKGAELEKAKVWAKGNSGVRNSITAKRRASKLQATPSWLSEKDQTQIKRIYTACTNVTERTGKSHHVDHIVPLQGENVCGLHVPWNLAIIPASMNLSKSNKF